MFDSTTHRTGSQTVAESVLSRLKRVRRNSRGSIAECPAHDDRGPSLSVGTGRDGRVLLWCFAGCSIETIVSALGLEMRDLFPADRERERTPSRSVHRPSAAEVRAEIDREVKGFREERGLEDSRLLTNEINSIRKHVATRLGVSLKPLPSSVYDGPYPHSRDLLWPTILESAYFTAWVTHIGVPPHTPIERTAESRIASMMLIEAQDGAAAQIRMIASQRSVDAR